MKSKKTNGYIVTFLLLSLLLNGCQTSKKSDNCDTSETATNSVTSDTASKTASSYVTYPATAESKQETSEFFDGATYVTDEFNTEEYQAVVENGFMDSLITPLSTFSADVDTASYSNVRRMILDGESIDPGAVRIEEFINYFHYDYDMPSKNQPFRVTKEIMSCPWNEDSMLLSIAIQTSPLDFSELPSSNIVFLLDVSGSMDEENKLPLMVKAFQMLSEQLTENDRISIVTYAGADQVLISGVSGSKKKLISNTLEELTASGCTNGSDGIVTAYEIAEEYFIDGGNNRVILATDGDLNVGLTSESELKALIEKERESGIFLSVLGFGTGNLKDNKMEVLADYGNGNYSYIDSLLEAKKVLVEEMGGTLFTVAKDVKFQVEFNPSVITEYRLLGYENRRLNAEDFDDDTKDAGELGAGHCVTALYELKLNKKEQRKDSGLKYQRTKLTDSKEWATVKIRYKEPEASESKLLEVPVNTESYYEVPSDNIRFASCVAEFGMLLRNSQYAGNLTYSDILEQLDQISLSKDEYKSEFRYLVETVKRTER